MKNKEQIVRLIKDDLKNSKLVDGLVGLGLKAGDYYLNLSDVVFELIGFDDCPKCEETYKGYLKRTVLVRQFKIEDEKSFTQFANELYEELENALKFQGHEK